MDETTSTSPSTENETGATLESIHRLMQDAAETREKYRALADEIKELTKKRSEAKRALQEDKDYQAIAADLDDYRLKLRDIQDILSQHLVLYYNQTQQTKIVDQGGETRSVILSAKVGKAEA